jgi:hypothetical protein
MFPRLGEFCECENDIIIYLFKIAIISLMKKRKKMDISVDKLIISEKGGN